MAAIEIKSTLSTGKKQGALAEALSSCKLVKSLNVSSPTKTNSVVVDSSRVPFILFAFKGPTLKTLEKYINSSIDGIQYLPDLIVVLDRGYYVSKNRSWHHIHENNMDAYNIKDDNDAVLLGLYEYILNLIEYWVVHPEKHTMPVKNYTKDMPSLFEFFE